MRGTCSAANTGAPGEVAQSALAAFDVACWDLMGQSLGVPVWKLLGGKFRDRVPAYANGWYQAEREAGAIARLARGVVERGYRALKLDPFGAASAELPADDRRRAESIVAAVREAVGPDVQMLIEMHGRFTPATAVRVAAMLEPYDPEWIEEPVPPENAAALARVKAATRIPIATGERAHTIADIREFIETGVADVVQVDLTHFGGFLPMKHLAGWADAHYLLLAPHNVCGPVGTMANVHFAVATPNYKVLEHFNDFADPWVQDLVDHRAAGLRRGWLLRPARASGSRRPAESRRLRRAPAHRRTAASVRGGLGKAGHPLTSGVDASGYSDSPFGNTKDTGEVDSVCRPLLKATRKPCRITERGCDRRSAAHAGSKRGVDRARRGSGRRCSRR